MKILLVGEYSRLHNSLKEGLECLGHEASIISSGDYFKNYPTDIKLHRVFDHGLGRKIKVAIYKLTQKDITSIALLKQAFQHKKSLTDYDVVQLINERPIGAQATEEQKLMRFLKKHNNKLFLLCCGTDYISVKYAFDKKFRYSILTPFFENKLSAKSFTHILNLLKPNYYKHHQFVYQQIHGVIASDMDYHLPMKNHPKYLGMIPNPINTDKIKYIDNPIRDKIVIFHGINRANYYKKGNDLFEKALDIILQKYPNKLEIIVSENVPYQTYIHSYNKAHILLDQVYAYDQGYNALEAMAKGKVVFTGAEKEFCEYYNLQENEVCVNALPDVNDLVEKLSWLIEHPDKIIEIGKNARLFTEHYHNYVDIAKKYISIWEKA